VKLAIIADTHLPRGARRLPRECVRRLGESDLILHGGDFSTIAVLREFERLASVAGVLGNNDEPALADLLPERRVVEVEGARIGMVHDGGRRAGRNARLLRLFPDCDAVVYAHSHLPEVTRERDVWILNPGSPTERRRAPARSMLEVVVADSFVSRPTLVTFGS
jgi:putative phosphoesterase